MSDQTVLLPKLFSHGGIILAKGQLDHSCTFWTMSILIFSPVFFCLGHPLQATSQTRNNMPEIFSPMKSSQLANSSEPLSELFLKFAKIFQCEMRISDLSFSMYVNIKGRKFSRSLFLAFQKN